MLSAGATRTAAAAAGAMHTWECRVLLGRIQEADVLSALPTDGAAEQDQEQEAEREGAQKKRARHGSGGDGDGDSRKRVIGTHSGKFHCDEALACAMLKTLPEFADATVVRTRNPEVLAQCDIVVDVGGTYDPETRRFDHHQREFEGVMEPFQTKLSSAGLVYKHYGREVVRAIAQHTEPPACTTAPVDVADNEELVETLFTRTYEAFVEQVDAVDNGIDVGDNLRYRITSGLSSRVGHLNPSWNEVHDGPVDVVQNARFRQAMALTLTELIQTVAGFVFHWWPARSLVQNAITNRANVHPSGHVVELEQFCPWQEHLFDLEAGANDLDDGHIKYCVYQDSGGQWRVHAVPEAIGSFACRLALPKDWRGLRDDELSQLNGIEQCVFAHASGFIGGNRTREGALQMAIESCRVQGLIE